MIEQQNISVRLKSDGEPIPYHLLLLADETKEAIDKYLHFCKLLIVEDTAAQQLIGVAAVCPLNQQVLEIKNIAIDTPFQRKGLGSYLLKQVVSYATQHKYKKLIVGTGDHSYEAQRFYEKHSFRPFTLRKDFFIKEYSKPIIEHGQQLKDMIVYQLDI